MANYQSAYSGAQIDTAVEKINNLLEYIYPVGSIYMSVNATNPATFIGGTWARITDCFLLASGNTYAPGTTGGAATVTLTTDQLPAHAHSVEQQYLHRLDSSDNNFANYAAGGSLGGWGLGTTTNNKGTTRLGIPAFSTNNAGSTQAHNNMPPYLAVYVWQRMS